MVYSNKNKYAEKFLTQGHLILTHDIESGCYFIHILEICELKLVFSCSLDLSSLADYIYVTTALKHISV